MATRKTPKKATRERKNAGKHRQAGKSAAKGRIPAPPPSKVESKQAQLIVLLQQADGTSIAEAASALGWQPHSIRGVLSGVIRKKLKLPVEKFDAEGVTRYRVAE